MKRWGFIVAGLYALVLMALAGPLAGAIFFSPRQGWSGFWRDVFGAYTDPTAPQMWLAVVLVALVTQAALLTVPVELSARRPVTRRSILPMVLATSLAVAILFAGVVFALDEVFQKDFLGSPDWLALKLFLLVWAVWALVFFRLGRNDGPEDRISRLCRWILRGSILELLIAVPSHIYVRQRNDCCAGLSTGLGIALGIAVMFFSFGPGVYFLFVERIKRLSRKRGVPGGTANSSG